MKANEIKAIDKTSVHRICSGQVVLSLAVAVKELLENSLDAGATVVEIRLKDYGNDLIEVIDNGSGVHPDNFQALTLKHHTSKLSDFSDLESVSTFGFRGEALSSLCALSKVTVCTRHASQEVGTLLQFNHNGIITSQNSLSRQIGTTVSLSNIFSTLPVRQKEFQRNLKKEFNKMIQLVYAYCLVSTNVRISCVNQTSKGSKTTLVTTQGCASVKENISCVFGPKQLAGLMELKKVKLSDEAIDELKVSADVLGMFTLEGYVSSCAHGAGRAASDRQFYYINSRPCEPAKIMKAVNEVYHQFNVHQSPFVFLNVFVSRDSVDVNVTPDKRQIFLDQEKLLLTVIKASLVDLYDKIPSTYSVNTIKSSAPASTSSLASPTASLSKFSQWRHKSDTTAKREPLDQLSPDKKPKQRKLDCDFAFSLKKKYGNKDEGIDQNGDNIEVKNYGNMNENVSQNSEADDHMNPDDFLLKKENKEVTFDENKLEIELSVSQTGDGIEAELDTSEEGKGFGGTDVLKSQISSSSNSCVVEKSDKSEDMTSNSEASVPEVAVMAEEASLRSSEFVASTEVIDGGKQQSESESSSVEENDSRVIKLTDVTSKVGDSDGGQSTRVITDEGLPVGPRKVVIHDLDLDSLKQLCGQTDCAESKTNSPKVRFRTLIDPANNSKAEEELSKEITKDMFSKMEIIGQFNLGFIITKLGSDLFIIDQHATDEKYNFEMLQRTTALSSQNLVLPQNLDLTPANECLLLENIDIFRKNGFDFSIDENAPSNRAKLSAIPMSRNWIFGKEDVDELLFMLQDSPGTLCRPSRVRSMFASRACRKSVMIGSFLSRKDMRRLVDHMGEIEQPWNCPHGRPTMRHLVNLALLS